MIKLMICDPELGTLKETNRVLFGTGRNTNHWCCRIPRIIITPMDNAVTIMLQEMERRFHLVGPNPHIFTWAETVIRNTHIFLITLSPKVRRRMKRGINQLEETPGGILRREYNWRK